MYTEKVMLEIKTVEDTEVKAKAFLSCKTVGKLVLEDSGTAIGDWAFAICRTSIRLFCRDMRSLLERKFFSTVKS